MKQYTYRKKWLIFLAYASDLLAGIFYFKRKINFKGPIKKILVVNFGHLGDILMMTPFLDILRNNFPQTKIDVLIGPWGKEVLDGSKSIDNLFIYSAFHYNRGADKKINFKKTWQLVKNLKKEKYDLFFDLRGDPFVILLGFFIGAKRRIGYGTGGLGRLLADEVNLNPNQHQVFVNLDLLKPLGIIFSKEEVRLLLPLKPESLAQAEFFLRQNNVTPQDFLIIAHPGSGYESKIWPSEHWTELIEMLLGRPKVKIIVIGVSSETSLIRKVSRNKDSVIAVIDFNLQFLSAIISKANLLIGSDSGPAHLAAALDIPVVSIFSAENDPTRWEPFSDKLYLFYKDVPCQNCEKRNCPDKICLKLIKPAEIFNTVARIIKQE